MPDLLESRAEARKAGHRRYFRQQPCEFGHVSPHYVTGLPACMVCRAAEEALLPADMPATPSEALAYGLTTYFTGEPCQFGHVSPRRAKTRECLKCVAARRREPARRRSGPSVRRRRRAARRRLWWPTAWSRSRSAEAFITLPTFSLTLKVRFSP